MRKDSYSGKFATKIRKGEEKISLAFSVLLMVELTLLKCLRDTLTEDNLVLANHVRVAVAASD